MAKAARQFLGVFESMDFPDYKFEEYPKVVGYKDAARMDPITVANAKEEIDFITHGGPGAVRSKEEELRQELDKKALELQQAQEQLDALRAANKEAEAQKASADKAPVIEKIELPIKKA